MWLTIVGVVVALFVFVFSSLLFVVAGVLRKEDRYAYLTALFFAVALLLVGILWVIVVTDHYITTL